MFVRRRMKKKVVTIDHEQNLIEAKKLMGRHKVNQLPVTHAGKLVGIISRRDIQAATIPLMLLGEKQEGRIRELLDTTTVSRLMTKEPVVTTVDDTLEDAVMLLYEYRVNSLPVLDRSGDLCGIITKTDILQAFIEALGVNEVSQRLEVVIADEPGSLSEVINIIKQFGTNLISIMTTPHPDRGKRIVYLRVSALNVVPIKEALASSGIKILEPWNL